MIPKIDEGNWKEMINQAIQENRHVDYLKKVLSDYEKYKRKFQDAITQKNPKDDIYCFRVTYLRGKNTWRDIEISGQQNFEKFASTIIKSMDWIEDHMHGFSFPDPNPQNKILGISPYTFFRREWEDDPHPTFKSNQIKIYQIDYDKFPNLRFEFDFGDGHLFDIKLQKIRKKESREISKNFPKVINKNGIAPEQYPPCDESEEVEPDQNFADLDEKELIKILDKGDLNQDDFSQLITAMQAKGLNGSIMTVDDPNSEEGKTAQEYIDYHQKLPKTFPMISEKEITGAKKTLLSKQTNIENKKKALIILAHTGQLDAYKTLEIYEKKPDPELKIWINMAIQECETFLKSDLTNKSIIDISKITKIGRNDLCPCGSGKKYKRCCDQ